MELGFAVVAALLFLAWLTERRWLLWPAFLLSLGLGSGLSLASHQSDDRGWLPSFADWVHLSAATLWIGGLLSLGLVVWHDRELRRTAFWRFSEIAGPLVALVVAAGVYMTFKRFPALHDLWSVGYGKLLLVKLSLVCLALSWGAFHHFVVRPRLDRPAVAAAAAGGLAGEATVAVVDPAARGDPGRLEAACEAGPAPTQALTPPCDRAAASARSARCAPARKLDSVRVRRWSDPRR